MNPQGSPLPAPTAPGREALDATYATDTAESPRRRDARFETELALVIAVLGGWRTGPLEGTESKVLNFMLRGEEGCDATIDERGFSIRFGWHPSKHRYHPDLAPLVVSCLLTWAGIETPPVPRAFFLPARDVPQVRWPVAWSFESRRVWLLPTPTSVSVLVRAAEHGDTPLAADSWPLPPPIRAERHTATFESALPCPRCAQPSRRYRSLHDALVCGQCGRSFELPPGILSLARIEEVPWEGGSGAS